MAYHRLGRRSRAPLGGSHDRGRTWRRRNPHHLGKESESPRTISLRLPSVTKSGENSDGSRVSPTRKLIFPMLRKESHPRRRFISHVFTDRLSNWSVFVSTRSALHDFAAP